MNSIKEKIIYLCDVANKGGFTVKELVIETSDFKKLLNEIWPNYTMTDFKTHEGKDASGLVVSGVIVWTGEKNYG